MRTYEFHISAAEVGERLDRYLTHHVPPTISRAVLQRAIQQGLITVSQQPVKPNYKLRKHDVVIAHLAQLPAAPRDIELTPQQIPLEIVYEDAELLIVNKPPGLVTHPAPGHWDGTLVNAIVWHLSHGQSSPSTVVPPRAGIVHRLDKDTSGLLIVAKTVLAHTFLSRQLKARLIHRRYLALVEGHLPLDQGTMNAPIGRHHIHRKEMTIKHLGGRGAVTHYRVQRRLTKQDILYSVIEVQLETGRTHQIRVHMAHLGFPVLGDTVYGRRPQSFWQEKGIARQMLHAYALTLQHPQTHKSLVFQANLPEDMKLWAS